MTKKAQTSMELITGIVFLSLIFLIFLIVANEYLRESNDIKSWIDAKRICRKFAMNIDTISTQGNSYYKKFKLPAKLYKNFDYNLSVYSNRVEISWDSKLSPYSSAIVTSNVTIYCIDKDEYKENKILNDNESVIVICYKPELIILKDKLYPTEVNSGEKVNLSVWIKNIGLVKAEQFKVLFNSQELVVNSLGVDEATKIFVNYTAPLTSGNYTVSIILDPNDDIDESIESNNYYNATIFVR
ncbi:MAG: CARDB domain-containing protein [Candidatus Altiarchaeota archaeon]